MVMQKYISISTDPHHNAIDPDTECIGCGQDSSRTPWSYVTHASKASTQPALACQQYPAQIPGTAKAAEACNSCQEDSKITQSLPRNCTPEYNSSASPHTGTVPGPHIQPGATAARQHRLQQGGAHTVQLCASTRFSAPLQHQAAVQASLHRVPQQT